MLVFINIDAMLPSKFKFGIMHITNTIMLTYKPCTEKDKAERDASRRKIHEEEEDEYRGGNGGIDGINRLESSVKSIEDEWNEWREVALVWREDEQS